MRARVILPTLVAAVAAAPAGGQQLALRGDVTPLNIDVAAGQNPTGTVSRSESDGRLTIQLEAGGLLPGMHLAHLHGFAAEDPAEAACPGIQADANGDGVVDLIETRDAAGVTLVPLSDDPDSLEIAVESYPTADQDGHITYRQTVDLAALERAMAEAYVTPPALERRVLFIHGVAPEVGLADSVQSLEGVPAHATLPIGCAELKPPV